MQTETFETPVALFVFSRPDTTRRIFEAVAAVRPSRLLLIADGPRSHKDREAEACQQVREILSNVDWSCEVSTNFADRNLGCQERIVSGLNWVFSLVEEAIILEDDCLPDPSFFPFCRELLERYRGDSRIAYISGDCLVKPQRDLDASYYFSQIGGIWGWATWRAAWQNYERRLESWPTLRAQGMLSEVFDDARAVTFWTRIFDAMHDGTGPNTWDYQWVYTCLKHNSLVVTPGVNLVANIGFGEGATHTLEADHRFILPATAVKFPLRHPSSFIPMRSIDRRVQALSYTSISQRILRKIRRFCGDLCR
jgi:hypothetical protein